jgi:predicted anti-sigma-YlaC factor YlaD
MTHPNEEELIAYHDGEVLRRDVIAKHVGDCPECRAVLERIDAVLAALDTIPVPDPGEDYGQRVWQQISARLPERRARWREFWAKRQRTTARTAAGWPGAGWLDTRRWAALGAVAALVIVAFVAGRLTTKRVTSGPESTVADASKVRERVLLMAVGEHLGRSEMVLVELANAAPANANQKQVNLSAEEHRAENLLEENRLYRQTALEQGDTGLADVLDELERVLLDVAHSPDKVTPAQLENIRQRIEAKGILFKVRVVGQELQQREESTTPSESNDSGKKERNKA